MNIERIPKNGLQFSSSRRGKGRNLFGNDDMAQTSWTQIGNKREGGRGRHRTSPGRCLTIHYLNQRHACLPSLCATCKYSGRRRCSTRVDENRRCVYTQAMTATMMAERGSGCHPANSIPFLYIGRVTLRKFVNAALEHRLPLCDPCYDEKRKNLGRVCRVIYSLLPLLPSPLTHLAALASIRIIGPVPEFAPSREN